MTNRRTLLRYALWAAPLAVTMSLFGPSQAHAQSRSPGEPQMLAQSEQRQRDLDRAIEQKRRDRQLDMQQDRNSAQDQLQRQEIERKLREQQNRDQQRNNLRRDTLQNQRQPGGT